MGALLQANNLVKEYEGNEVLRNVSLSIQVGEYVAVMGQSGCGKSTLLYNISGMDSVTKGNIFFEGNEMTALSEEEMSSIRLGKMGFVFQNSNLLRNLSLRDNKYTYYLLRIKKTLKFCQLFCILFYIELVILKYKIFCIKNWFGNQ
jgi:ABC-type lipoprotein export system ATPase subunit